MLLQNVNLLMNPIKSKIICYHQAREIAAEGQGERKKERKRERKRESVCVVGGRVNAVGILLSSDDTRE